MATPTGPTDPTVGTTHDAPTTMETTGTQTSRKEFLGTAAKAVAGAAAAGAGLGVAPALAAGSRRLPEIMRKGSPVTLRAIAFKFGLWEAQIKDLVRQ